ncbi:MAG: alanyl-tRNA editing protein [Gammaproteobacteria bacterium]|nr:alanyl-tRNA editing protein [Gammaproteobacteria bacterium]
MSAAATRLLFREDPYLRTCRATVSRLSEQGVTFDQTVFYPRGGGQPGDTGTIARSDESSLGILDTVHGGNGEVLHVISGAEGLCIGEEVELCLDWKRRYAHMRMHTALHLLGAVVPFGVTGGNISAARSRLDFDMQESLDKDQVTSLLNALVSADHPVISRWITQAELAARPELVRTMSVRPPQQVERLRLLEIPGVDLQPCGGTHVSRTSEIGCLKVSKVEKKGRRNRRVHITLD